MSLVNPKLKTPLDYLWNGCPEQALKMLKADRSWITNVEPEFHCTPLHHAASFGYTNVVVWLLENGANVNSVADNDFTPLYMTERKKIAELLIEAGADLAHKDSEGKTPLQFAVEERHQEVVEAIEESGSKLDLYSVIQLGRRDLALKMLTQDASVI